MTMVSKPGNMGTTRNTQSIRSRQMPLAEMIIGQKESPVPRTAPESTSTPHIGEVERNGELYRAHADAQNSFRGGEPAQQGMGEGQQYRAAQSGNGKAHEQADPHTAAYPAVFLGAEVLSHKGGDRNTQRTHDHPEQTVHLAVSGPGGDGIGTEGVDAGLDNDIGDGEHIALEGSGQAHTQNPAGAITVKPISLRVR